MPGRRLLRRLNLRLSYCRMRRVGDALVSVRVAILHCLVGAFDQGPPVDSTVPARRRGSLGRAKFATARCHLNEQFESSSFSWITHADAPVAGRAHPISGFSAVGPSSDRKLLFALGSGRE
jgi:hypothetical protein